MRRLSLSLSVLFFACGTDVIDHTETNDCNGVVEETIEGSAMLEIRSVSEYGFTPIGGVAIQINDEPWTMTDAEGHLSVPAPNAPYTFRAHQITSSGRYDFRDIWEVRNLTGNSLTLCADGSATARREANVKGRVDGVASGQQVQVFIPSHGIGPLGASRAPADGTGAYEIPVSWEGDTRDVEVRAIASDASSPPNQYFGYASAPLVLADPGGMGGDLDAGILTLAPVEQERVRGTVVVPPGFTELGSSPYLELGGTTLRLGEGMIDSASPAFDYAFPEIEGAQASLEMFAYAPEVGSTWQVKPLALPADDVEFDLPPPIVLLQPTDGATIAPSTTTFTWNAGPAGGAMNLHFGCEWMEGEMSRNANYRYIGPVGTEATLPAIPELAIPSGTPCDWSVGWVSRTGGDIRGSSSLRRQIFIQ